MSASDSRFDANLASLVSKEMSAARNDPERMAGVIESLIRSTGLSVAIAAGGNPKRMDTLLKGAESYLYEAAAERAEIGSLMAGIVGGLNRMSSRDRS